MAEPELYHEENISKSKETRFPGEEGIWVFVLGDMVVFALFFCVFLDVRNEDVELFQLSKLKLNLHFGMLNTILLLISSWFVACSIAAFRRRDSLGCQGAMGAALVCGVAFVVVKYFEWNEKLAAGLTLQTNDFFTLYYVFTGIHLVHLLVGVGILGYLLFSLSRSGLESVTDMTFESSATYWHMVDLLWILIFPLIYLLP